MCDETPSTVLIFLSFLLVRRIFVVCEPDFHTENLFSLLAAPVVVSLKCHCDLNVDNSGVNF